MLARTAIRNAAIEALSDITAVGGRIYDSVNRPGAPLPNIVVSTPLESAMRSAYTGGDEYNEVMLRIDIRAEATSALDDTLDAIAAEVESAIYSAGDLQGLIIGQEYLSTQTSLSGDQEKPCGLASLHYSLNYIATTSEPEYSEFTTQAGESLIVALCDVDRLSKCQFKAVQLTGYGGDEMPLKYKESSWESTYKIKGHGGNISALTANKYYNVYVRINGYVDPDLEYTLAATNVHTLAAGGGNPDPYEE